MTLLLFASAILLSTVMPDQAEGAAQTYVCDTWPLGGSATFEPLTFDNEYALSVVSSADETSPFAVFGPFDENTYCFDTAEVYIETTTIWRVLGSDDLPVELNNTRIRMQFVLALRGQRNEAWWRLVYEGEPYIERQVSDDGVGFEVAGVSLDTANPLIPIIRVDFLTHNMTMSGREMTDASSISFDLRYSRPLVAAILAYPPLVQITAGIGEPASSCYFALDNPQAICDDFDFATARWIERACQQVSDRGP